MAVSKSVFGADRAIKYGFGAARLIFLTWLCVKLTSSFDLLAGRWLIPVFAGAIGAIVNVEILSPKFNLVMFAACAASIIFDVRVNDASLAIYLSKTMAGDFFAGKLDTTEWRIAGIFGVALVSYAMFSLEETSTEFGRIWVLLFVGQVFCEYGDAHFEDWLFFRHRYSFEIVSALTLIAVPSMTSMERRVVLMDMVACSAYRASNIGIIFARAMLSWSDSSEKLLNDWLRIRHDAYVLADE